MAMRWLLLALFIVVQAPEKTAQTNPADDFLMGGSDSPVKMELFSDFQCPSCRTFYLDTVTRLLSEYAAGKKVCFVFRDFPLSGHTIARVAARYALASKSLGRDRWLKVIEYLYTCQAEWSYDGKFEPVLARILSARDMEKLKEELKNPAIEQTIDRTVTLGNSKNVTSTPTYFVTMGGKEQRVQNGLSFPVLKEFIEPYLK
jgi:protein-disulfide isomerase